MTTKREISEFLALRRLAVVGVSRSRKKFGSVVYRDLREKGYEVFPVNPAVDSIEGEPCYSDLKGIPRPVDGVVFVTPPAVTRAVLEGAVAQGIKKTWLQQGAESPEVIDYCKENGISVIHGECILMFAEPAATIHRIHRWLWKILGKLPK